MSFPTLYKKMETNFFHLGLGILRDAISCLVTEERNGIFELEMEYPMSGTLFECLENDQLIKVDAGHELKDQLFRIKRIIKNGEGIATIYAQHVSYLTQDLTLRPEVSLRGTGQQALQQWRASIIDENPFTVYSDVNLERATTLTIQEVENARRALGGTQHSILDIWGGEYKFDNYQISLLENRGRNANTLISYGRNLTDIQQEENIANTYTSIYPFAMYQEASEIGDQTEEILVTVPGFIVDSKHVEAFPNRRILPVDFSQAFENEEIPTSGKLLALAREYIEVHQIGIPRVSMSVSFIDLTKALDFQGGPQEAINLCDVIPIYFEKLGIRARAKVIRTTWNVLLSRYETLEIGEPRMTLSDKIRDIEDDINTIGNRPPVIGGEHIANVTPRPVTNLKAVGGYGAIHLFWDNQGLTVNHFELYRSMVSNFTPNEDTRIYRGRGNGFSDIVGTNRQYFYRCRAMNYHGVAGDWSTEVMAQTANSIPIEELERDLEDLEYRLTENEDKLETLENQTLPNLNNKLEDHEKALDDNRDRLDELENETLPKLDGRLEANERILNDFKNKTLPELESNLGENRDRLDELENETLPNLNNKLEDHEKVLDDLKNETIPGLENKLEANEIKVNGTLDGLGNTFNSINRIDNDLGTLDTRLTQNTAAIGELNHTTIPDLNREIASNKTAITNAQNNLNTLNNTTIPGLNTRLTENDTKINHAQKDIEELNEETIPSLNREIASNKTAVINAQTSLNTLNNTTIPALNTRLNENNTKINNAQQDIEELNEKTIPTLNREIASNKTAVTNAQTSLNTLNNTTIPNLNRDLEANKTAIHNTQNNVNSAMSDVKELENLTDSWRWLNSTEIDGGSIRTNTVTALQINSRTITASEIATGAVTANEIATNAITADKINANAVTTSKIATNAITANEIATGTIVADNIASNAITAIKINANAVTTDKISTNAVTTAKINAGSVTADKVGANAITADKINANAVTTSKIATNAVTANEIATGTIVADNIASNAITAVKINASAVTTDKINANAVTTAKLNAGSVTADKVATNAITAVKISANAVTTDKINAGAVTANEIATNAIIAAKISANAVTTDKINTGAVTANEIATNAVTAIKINANAVTTDKINSGAITADKIGANAVTANKIASNAIETRHLTIADFTNLAQASEHDASTLINGSVVTANNFRWIQTGNLTTAGHHGLHIARSFIPTFQVGDQFHVRFTGQRVAGTSGTLFTQIRFIIRYHYSDGTWVNAGAANGVNLPTTASEISQNVTITNAMDQGRTLTHISYFFEAGSSGTGQIRIRNIGLFRRNNGQLIVDGSIQATHIVSNAITADKINANAVTTAKINTGAVTATEIATNAITAVKISAGSVNADKIAANAITADKINANAVTTGKINAGAVTANEIATNAITAVKINANAVTTDKISTNAVTTGKINAGAVTASEIATNAITAVKISANAITADKINANAVTTGKINAGAVTATEIATNAITAVKINANAITADKISVNAVTADKISANAVTANKIATNAIEARHIRAGAITADDITSGTLRSVTINGVTINGSVITSEASGSIVTMTQGQVTMNQTTGSNQSESLINPTQLRFRPRSSNLPLSGNIPNNLEVQYRPEGIYRRIGTAGQLDNFTHYINFTDSTEGIRIFGRMSIGLHGNADGSSIGLTLNNSQINAVSRLHFNHLTGVNTGLWFANTSANQRWNMFNASANGNAGHDWLHISGFRPAANGSLANAQIMSFKRSGQAGGTTYETDRGSIRIGTGNVNVTSGTGWNDRAHLAITGNCFGVARTGIGYNWLNLWVSSTGQVRSNLAGSGSAGSLRPMNALNFNTSSSRATKTNLVVMSELEELAIHLINRTNLYEYDLIQEVEAGIAYKNYGVVVEEAPIEIVSRDGGSVSLYPMITYAWKAIQELSIENNDLKERITRLEMLIGGMN